MPEKLLPVEQVLSLLAETPRRIDAIAAEVDPTRLNVRPSPDEWSANDVLAHLRACADVWGDCIAAIIADDHPTLRASNPRTWIKRTNYPDLAFAKSARAFIEQRSALLTALDALPPEGWLRAATVTGAGKPLERTVQFYAQWLARHERAHLRQMEEVARRAQR